MFTCYPEGHGTLSELAIVFKLFDHTVSEDTTRMRWCGLFVSLLFLSGMVVRGGARVAPPLAKLRLAPFATMTAVHSGATCHTLTD